MTIPWITRSSHLEVVTLLTSQLGELKAERTILLDRLATLGLGGPLFQPLASLADEPDETSLEAQELQILRNLRRRPSKLATALSRKAHRDQAQASGPSVKWIPRVDVHTALDEAEAAGKTQA
jgi:hypothetical protein